jgi:hypothetical protein
MGSCRRLAQIRDHECDEIILMKIGNQFHGSAPFNFAGDLSEHLPSQRRFAVIASDDVPSHAQGNLFPLE